MSPIRKNALIGVAALAIAGATAWLWFDNMELRWTSKARVSAAATENRMLGASRLLTAMGRQVTLANSLAEVSISRLPDGMLIASDRHGLVSPRQGRELLAWVRRGNTLVTQPRWMTFEEKKRARGAAQPAETPDPDGAEDPDASEDPDHEELTPVGVAGGDPVGERLGVRLRVIPEMDDCPVSPAGGQDAKPGRTMNKACIEAYTTKKAQRGTVIPPGLAYKLYLESHTLILAGMPGAAPPLWSDEYGEQVRVYGEGKGHIAMLSRDFFENRLLRNLDHAELLQELAALNPAAKHVTIVKHLTALPWYKALWQFYSQALIALALTLALLLWAAARRFGPVLPPPQGARRALIEHIEAAGAWLWKAEGGRQLLLEAARADTLALVRRRAPAIARMAPDELAATLARECAVGQSHIIEALQREAAPELLQFTRQIRTLQRLRNHYER